LESQEFYITLKVACYFLLYYSYAGNQGKLEKTNKQTNKPWKISFLISVFIYQPHGQPMEKTAMKHRKERGMKGLLILVFSTYFYFSQKHPVCSG